jgi:hypothetical protein|tara:strand:- start:250 stop:480 length:231 start_codon:yes stop_codon:yes gene_type:complete
MGSIFKPKMPPPPQMIMPVKEDVPSYEDEEREAAEKERLASIEKKRKGRRSTILSGSTGLNEIEDENISKKTLLGG